MGVQLSVEELDEISYPAMTTMKNGNFVILKEVANNQVVYLDPAKEWVTQSLAEFEKQWDGVTVLAEVSEESGETDFAQNRKKNRSNNGVFLCL